MAWQAAADSALPTQAWLAVDKASWLETEYGLAANTLQDVCHMASASSGEKYRAQGMCLRSASLEGTTCHCLSSALETDLMKGQEAKLMGKALTTPRAG